MLKRLLDIVIASSALVLLSPIYALVAYKVKKNLGSPVLFRQVRPGLHGKPFEMIKFRTMLDAYDEKGNLLPNDQRFTKFGNFLSIDLLFAITDGFNNFSYFSSFQ